MIDTDKYEGHTPAPWEEVHLLLEEIKRLRDFIQSVWDGLGEAGRNEHYELFKEYMGEEE